MQRIETTMTELPYRAAIAAYIRAEAQPPDKYSHQLRLYRLAIEIGRDQTYDDDVLYAAVWLHDLGVFLGHRPADLEALARWDNVAYACAQVPALLERFGFPPAKIPHVIEVIRTHLPSGEPQSIEATLLRDADILEQLGAIGILRIVSKVGRDTRYPTFAEAVATLQRNLVELPDQVRLVTTQQLVVERVRHLRAFLEGVAVEADAGML